MSKGVNSKPLSLSVYLDELIPFYGTLVCFAPPNDLLAIALGETIYVFEVTKPIPIYKIKGHDCAISTIAADPTGRLIASGDISGTMAIWNLTDASLITGITMPAHRGRVWCLAFNPDGHLLASCGDDAVSIWSVAHLSKGGNERERGAKGVLGTIQSIFGQQRSSWPRLKAQTLNREGGGKSLTFSPDGSLLVVGGSDGHVRFLSTANWSVSQSFAADRLVTNVTFSPDGILLAAASGGSGRIYLWHLSDETRSRVLQGHRGAANSIAFAGSGKYLVSCGEDQMLMMWRIRDGQPISSKDLGERLFSVAVSRDNQFVATREAKDKFRVWRVDDMSVIMTN